ncbi:MAG: hypothetical protein JKY96_04115, partial [Phycisphaerales bacterium]|nr:hypothetical protein [Phycisphaerales bacterium]
TSAINTSFPMQPGDREPIARGKSESLILVQVPKQFSKNHAEFINLLTHVTIDQSYPELHARRYAMTLVNNTDLSSDMSWCLQAMGKRSLPFLLDIYDSPDSTPRLAALRAGAALNDPRAAKALEDIAVNGPENLRTDAIELLSRINGRPTIDRTLRSLLESEEFSIRVEAYEGLVKRAINSRKRQIINQIASSDAYSTPNLSMSQIDVLAKSWLPSDPIRGVSRQMVAKKFFLDIVPYGEPLIYVTQQDVPRIVLFGRNLEIQRPLLASAWSDRLMITADSSTDDVRLYYRNNKTRQTIINQDTPTSLPELVSYFANDHSTNEFKSGLGMSYSQVVGALYELHSDKGIAAGFATEQDRLLADLLNSVRGEEIEIRPETPDGMTTLVPINNPNAPVIDRKDSLRTTRRTLLVPVNPPSDDEEDDEENTNEPVSHAE